MEERPHDWRTVIEHLHEDGLLQVQHCRRCDAGRTTTTNHETGARQIVKTYPDPLPARCPDTHDFTPTEPAADGKAGQTADKRSQESHLAARPASSLRV